MANFAQLGLSGNPDKKPTTKPLGKTPRNMPEGPCPSPKKPGNKQQTVALVGSLIATSLLGVFLFESGCSKESNNTSAIVTPNQSVASQPIRPVVTTSISTSTAPAQPPAKKKSRQRKLSASTYVDPTHGVSFRYPKNGSLKQGDEANLELDGLGPFEMNFIQPGGTTVSAVELPRRLYAGTDFNAAFFNVSVNPEMSSEECEQFAYPGTGDQETDPITTSKTKIGSTEFHAVEAFAETENNQADVKYYHVFRDGSCYEFALGLETAGGTIPDQTKSAGKLSLKPVDRNEVFRQLNWILSTVEIQPISTPDKTASKVATDTVTPTNTVITEAH
jgi:hypothetical protein